MDAGDDEFFFNVQEEMESEVERSGRSKMQKRIGPGARFEWVLKLTPGLMRFCNF